MPESTEYRAWLDETEREAYEMIARRYDEGRAALDLRTDEDAADQDGNGESEGSQRQGEAS
ncbi:hypothetical protein [Haloechinothrix sp. LS1_15]|uniref:hypothetical protein n=1 Tax=Haloechinothrix sp. LS1_15 TaxID=2652248 RepID=UPI002944D97C|nr:hypothetical protein [Haloechinothrix sp. LS1_15]MDV6010938.1 hypothetical protein [Haloechinothrix sp. LS1_15]